MKRRIAEWYIKNKNQIMFGIFLIIVIVVVSIIVGILAKIERDKKQEPTNTIAKPEVDLSQNFNDIYVEGGESVITGEEITSSQVSMLEVIERFTQYCNDGKITEAYNLLSDECKEEVYSTLDSFKNNYYNKVFNGQKRNVSAEYWTSNIYKVQFEQDALSTGIYTEENIIQDYISVIKDENDEPKLNVNSYIGRYEINKTANTQNVNITVNRKDTYMEYQTYTFTVTNNTNNTILLDDKNDTNNMYLEDENGNQYTAYIHELSEEQLTITPRETKEITIKYYNKYGSTKNIKNIVFNKIILNYNQNEVRQFARVQIEI